MATKTQAKKTTKAKPKPSRKIYKWALVVPGAGSILAVAEDTLIDRIISKLKGGK